MLLVMGVLLGRAAAFSLAIEYIQHAKVMPPDEAFHIGFPLRTTLIQIDVHGGDQMWLQRFGHTKNEIVQVLQVCDGPRRRYAGGLLGDDIAARRPRSDPRGISQLSKIVMSVPSHWTYEPRK